MVVLVGSASHHEELSWILMKVGRRFYALGASMILVSVSVQHIPSSDWVASSRTLVDIFVGMVVQGHHMAYLGTFRLHSYVYLLVFHLASSQTPLRAGPLVWVGCVGGGPPFLNAGCQKEGVLFVFVLCCYQRIEFMHTRFHKMAPGILNNIQSTWHLVDIPLRPQ